MYPEIASSSIGTDFSSDQNEGGADQLALHHVILLNLFEDTYNIYLYQRCHSQAALDQPALSEPTDAFCLFSQASKGQDF